MRTIKQILMRTKTPKAVVVALAMSLAGFDSAKATPTLMFSADGGDWQTVQSSNGDASANVSFSGYLGGSGRWSVTGLNATVNYGIPQMDLNNVTAYSRFGGSLTIRLIETDLTLWVVDGIWINTLSAIVPNRSSLLVNTYFDSNNGDFQTTAGTPLTSQMLNYAGGVSVTDVTQNLTAKPESPFSMMIEVTINHRFGAETWLSDSLVDPVPDGGSTFVLIGMAFSTLVCLARGRLRG